MLKKTKHKSNVSPYATQKLHDLQFYVRTVYYFFLLLQIIICLFLLAGAVFKICMTLDILLLVETA